MHPINTINTIVNTYYNYYISIYYGTNSYYNSAFVSADIGTHRITIAGGTAVSLSGISLMGDVKAGE